MSLFHIDEGRIKYMLTRPLLFSQRRSPHAKSTSESTAYQKCLIGLHTQQSIDLHHNFICVNEIDTLACMWKAK